MTLGFDPYAALGVPRDASDAQITHARNELIRRYHPDVNSAPDAAARFNQIQRAFRLLSDPAARAEYDRAHADPDPGHVPGEAGRAAGAAPRFFIQPASVDFGVIEPGKPGVDKAVALYWTGAPPGRVVSKPGSGWWTIAHTGKLASSGVVFHLRAQVPVGAPNGRQHAKLRISLDDVSIAVPLTAEVSGKFPPGFHPGFEAHAPAADSSAGSLDWIFPVLLFAVLFIIMTITMV